MQIECSDLGKRYNRNWIFRHLDLSCASGQGISITGGNGSGKSTLLKVLAGYERFSEGKLRYSVGETTIGEENLYRSVSLCTPYQRMYDDLTAKEHFRLHSRFKKMQVPDYQAFKEVLGLAHIDQKPLKYFSSGMQQRVKLTLAILSDTPLLLLDEPVINLDAQAVKWYQQLVTRFLEKRLVIVASNRDEQEYFFCTKMINVEEYKRV